VLFVEQRRRADDRAAGLEDAMELPQDSLGLGQMLEHLVEHHVIEPAGIDRNAGQVADVSALRIRLVDLLEIGALVLRMRQQVPVRRIASAGVEHERPAWNPRRELAVVLREVDAR
jgi:hypothetical protein